MKLIVVTPEKKLVDADADSVELPGELGSLGILPGHTPLITLLKTGVLSYRKGTAESALAISGGFAEVANDNVTVLADLAERPEDIDAGSAERQRREAEEASRAASAETLPEILSRIELASARLAVARRAPSS